MRPPLESGKLHGEEGREIIHHLGGGNRGRQVVDKVESTEGNRGAQHIVLAACHIACASERLEDGTAVDLLPRCLTVMKTLEQAGLRK